MTLVALLTLWRPGTLSVAVAEQFAAPVHVETRLEILRAQVVETIVRAATRTERNRRAVAPRKAARRSASSMQIERLPRVLSSKRRKTASMAARSA